ncbi:hypothetical protein GCM10007989_21550 [Devosia pacifica]|uniref:HdeA/HdeB family protein n=1 Tax=Devosia pacifica TaxID=1335967 RepID=A0A918S5H4_9HYPH|nr:hypothetical protein [Devosia pacifica]GHA25563.1 hypothetical protein GCM10007989_21550 [Devosia pacifica]
MRRLVATLFMVFCCTPQLAAAPAPTDHVFGRAAEILLQRLVVANVAGMNCEDFALTDAEWLLIVDTADQLADQMQLTVERYDADYYGPAFHALDVTGFCANEGPKIAGLIKELMKRGGTLEDVTFD